MELTQRLESTQEFYGNRTEPPSLTEIGFLGICGQTYPVKRGPNKIGRDPDTCNIVLKLESISRQHAVINILNNNEYMLMDLGSANKTQLENKILQPYIPYPLRNGDTVQFGKIFGIFRLLEDDNDLPMTQAIDIPETPVPTRYISKLNNIHGTTIPESPDVSDKDESFIVSTQSKVNDEFKSPKRFIKSSGKVISIQPIGMKKIDNAYWSSAKKSDSFTSDSSSTMLNGSCAVKIDEEIENKSIYEMETQQPYCQPHDETAESIFNANTQIPEGVASATIHTMSTQVITKDSSMHEQHKEDASNGSHNKSKESIYNAYTKISDKPLSPLIYGIKTQLIPNKNLTGSNISDQIINDCDRNKSFDTIYDANTQVPNDSQSNMLVSGKEIKTSTMRNLHRSVTTKHQASHGHYDSTDSIYNANTQLPGYLSSPTINGKETQNMCDSKNLPSVCKVQIKQNVQLDLITENKENFNSVYDTKTVGDVSLQSIRKGYEDSNQILKSPDIIHNKSDDIILFDEIDSQPVEDECESQPLLSSQLLYLKQDLDNNYETKHSMVTNPTQNTERAARSHRLKSDSSTDCDDVDLMMSQRSPKKPVDEDLTDCEDVPEVNLKPDKKGSNTLNNDEETDCEDDQNESNILKESKKSVTDMNYEDLATQIVEGDLESKVDIIENEKQTDFEDMLTQIVVEDIPNNPSLTTNIDDLATQIISDDCIVLKESPVKENLTPFKVPFQSSLKLRKRDSTKYNPSGADFSSTNKVTNEDDANYYAATQEILNDLCTQKEPSPKLSLKSKAALLNQEISINDKRTTIENMNTSIEKLDSDVDEKVNEYISCLSSQQIRDVIGITKAAKLKKINSDSSSDIEITPKKKRPFRFMETELPNSQEIKNCVSVGSKSVTTETSSESEHESEPCTPILFRNKKKKQNLAKIDLTKKFDIESLPSRVITRVRKPTNKALDSHEISKNILKPKFLTDQEENIDNDIITENISRLKNKNSKSKNAAENKRKHSEKDDKKSKNNTKHKSDKEKKERSSTKRSKDKLNKDKIKDDKIIPNETSSRVSTESIHRPRSTRSGTKAKISSNSINSSKSPEVIAEDNVKSSHTHKKDKKETDKSKSLPDQETRRSARHKKADEENDNISKSKKNDQSRHEDSTVYSLSSESGIDTPHKLKRPATFDTEMPFAKKFKPDVRSNNTSSRTTPVRKVKKQYVLFTAFPCDEVRIKLENLGAEIVTNVLECTVVLTLQIKRTFKLLCAVGLGKPIVGPSWVQACVDNGVIVDPWLYLMKDETTEKRFQFNLRKTLSGKRNFLRGYKVSCTPNVMPSAQELELIVKCSGGTWKTGGRHWLCVSCSADRQLWPQAQASGAVVVSTELILGGVLRQKLDIDRNRLA